MLIVKFLTWKHMWDTLVMLFFLGGGITCFICHSSNRDPLLNFVLSSTSSWFSLRSVCCHGTRNAIIVGGFFYGHALLMHAPNKFNTICFRSPVRRARFTSELETHHSLVLRVLVSMIVFMCSLDCHKRRQSVSCDYIFSYSL